VIGVSTLLQKKAILSDEGARKFIHIGVAHWYLLTWWLVDNVWLAIIAPITFIFLNYASYKFDLIKAMERDEKSKNDLGTVYYAISLAIITYLSYTFSLQHVGAFALLVMGWGDGLSAILGKKYGRIELYNGKTLIGFGTVFMTTLVLGFIFLQLNFLIVVLAFFAAFLELISPRGFDNLTLPLGLYALLWVIAL
jgi:phytol kinase